MLHLILWIESLIQFYSKNHEKKKLKIISLLFFKSVLNEKARFLLTYHHFQWKQISTLGHWTRTNRDLWNYGNFCHSDTIIWKCECWTNQNVYFFTFHPSWLGYCSKNVKWLHCCKNSCYGKLNIRDKSMKNTLLLCYLISVYKYIFLNMNV